MSHVLGSRLLFKQCSKNIFGNIWSFSNLETILKATCNDKSYNRHHHTCEQLPESWTNTLAVALDQPLYAIAKCISMPLPTRHNKKKLVLMLSLLHTELAFINVLRLFRQKWLD